MPDITSTNNYDQFVLLGNNRDVREGHVKAIMRSLEKNGNWTLRRPIDVNESFHVIDGQHRLEACTRLGIPVGYIPYTH